ncbi:hypothetical protein [Haladaptatus litoreus]|nr:hypothetical protein [Haladaptatus litoreus]
MGMERTEMEVVRMVIGADRMVAKMAKAEMEMATEGMEASRTNE